MQIICIQNVILTPDKELNILIYRTPSYVIIWNSYTLLKMVQFFGPPCMCHWKFLLGDLLTPNFYPGRLFFFPQNVWSARDAGEIPKVSSESRNKCYWRQSAARRAWGRGVHRVTLKTKLRLLTLWPVTNTSSPWAVKLSCTVLFLQCLDTVGWVIWPVKPVPDMTYNVFGGTLNLAQLLYSISSF